MDYIDYIEINELKKDLREKYKLDPDAESKIEETFRNGIIFKNKEIKVIAVDYYNHLAARDCVWNYFICPKCLAKCRKLYVTGNLQVACRKCSKIKSKQKVNTPADRVIRIQMYLAELANPHTSAKKRRQLIKNITSHYQQLDSTYKMIYNTIAFKELQKWCLSANHDKNKSADYKEAAKDMLRILRDIRKVLVFSGLSKSKNNKLTI